MLSAAEVIRLLNLEPHPEGGHFVQTFRDPAVMNGRPASTAIYYLLARGERGHWHKVDAVEVWHYYAGAPLALETAASERGPIERVTLGPDLAAGQRPQAVVPVHVWQRRRVSATGRWSAARWRPVSNTRASSWRQRIGRRGDLAPALSDSQCQTAPGRSPDEPTGPREARPDDRLRDIRALPKGSAPHVASLMRATNLFF
jgi:uncharacterized protein